jgi:hypothetical protein
MCSKLNFQILLKIKFINNSKTNSCIKLRQSPPASGKAPCLLCAERQKGARSAPLTAQCAEKCGARLAVLAVQVSRAQRGLKRFRLYIAHLTDSECVKN